MSPEKRTIVYQLTAAIVPVLVAAGLLSDKLGQAILGLVASGITVAVALMAKKHVQKGTK